MAAEGTNRPLHPGDPFTALVGSAEDALGRVRDAGARLVSIAPQMLLQSPRGCVCVGRLQIVGRGRSNRSGHRRCGVVLGTLADHGGLRLHRGRGGGAVGRASSGIRLQEASLLAAELLLIVAGTQPPRTRGIGAAVDPAGADLAARTATAAGRRVQALLDPQRDALGGPARDPIRELVQIEGLGQALLDASGDPFSQRASKALAESPEGGAESSSRMVDRHDILVT